jgi:thiamine-phosphate pyrophosphorylase
LRSAFDAPILCYVTDGQEFLPTERHRALLPRISAAIDAGVDWIQIREKDLSGGALLALAREAVKMSTAAGRGTRILVNDRVDVALAAGAAGVHLGADALPVNEVVEWRRKGDFPAGFSIGASCHSVKDAQAAEAAGADHLFFGPVFYTPSKRMFGAPQGVGRLDQVCRAIKIPVLAVGGIQEKDAPECLKAGGAGIAAIRLFQQSREPMDFRDLVSRLHAFG